MSVTRACQPCRAAKAKCDLSRPACGRCNDKGLDCTGYSTDNVAGGFIFRDETQVAQTNSARARRSPKPSPTVSFTLSTTGIQRASPAMHRRSRSPQTNIDPELLEHYYWLNRNALAKMPAPLAIDIKTRAVERFFINWTLHPSNHGVSPGHMHNLPFLYAGVAPDSVLWLAVRAMAFADMRNETLVGNVDVPFHVEARQHYGAALARTRVIVGEDGGLANDEVLNAILLIDDFELMYLARTEPLGPHSGAIKYILQAKGANSLFDSTQFPLWRLAQHRLQARQILLREHPDQEQIDWISNLNIDCPDLRIYSDVLHMNLLSASARRLTEQQSDTFTLSEETEQTVRQLVEQMESLNRQIEAWTSGMIGIWLPKIRNSLDVHPDDDTQGYPIPKFPCPKTMLHHDIWLAYMWNFHGASQIIFRESLVDVLSIISETAEEQELIQQQIEYVEQLASSIIQSFPMLLGFAHRHKRSGPSTLPQGKMAGRLFSLFSVWVVQRAKFASEEHKKTAREVMEWINARHGLA